MLVSSPVCPGDESDLEVCMQLGSCPLPAYGGVCWVVPPVLWCATT